MPEVEGADPEQISTLAFEDAFRQLGDLASYLENGSLTLAEAVSRYEQGMILLRRCNQLLDEAELRITNLKDAYATPDPDFGPLVNSDNPAYPDQDSLEFPDEAA